MAIYYYQTSMVAISFLYLLSIIPPHICLVSASKKTSGFSLKMIHRDSPESPLYAGDNLTFHEKVSRYAKWSDARASSYIVARESTTVDSSVLRPFVYPDGNYHMVKFGIGIPRQETMLLLDTAADLTWMQCEPCDNCYPQGYSIYNSSNSRTFKPLHCNNPLCNNDIFECKDDTCSYHLYYGGGSRTTGVAMNELLSFVTTDAVRLYVENATIGCSKNSQSFGFDHGNGQIGGIFGLNPSPYSLLSQLDYLFHGKFSYCLSRDPNQSTYLRFGNDTIVGTGPLQSTPIVRISDVLYYGLNLVDISIGNHPSNFPAGTFAPKAGNMGGCYIDSGSPMMLIEETAYGTFIGEFMDFFAPGQIIRNIRDCPDDNIYCFYAIGITIEQLPVIGLHFEGGAVYTMQPENYVDYSIDSGESFVLMFKSAKRTVIGAWQQHDMRIIYDVNGGNLLFAPADCSKDV